jgi:Uma2 family endonuclease
MDAHSRYMLADDVRALPDDGNRYETVYGELLVTPAPRAPHQVVLSRLFLALGEYLKREPLGLLLSSPADISWRNDVLVQPDLFIARGIRAWDQPWTDFTNLLLTIEIISPSSRRADRFTKRKLYQDVGVPDYWVVDTVSSTIEWWTPDMQLPRTIEDRLVWRPSGTSSDVVLELAPLFDPVLL